jgi:hypothetical protein
MAGHGATTQVYGKKLAWFMPSDSPRRDFQKVALNLRRVEELSETILAKHVLWIFDSCFSGAAIKMIETRGESVEPDGYSVLLQTNPVRRVLTAGSEDEEVPSESYFTKRLIDALAGKERIGNHDAFVTGGELGQFLIEDVSRYAYKQGFKLTPQSDTIVILGQEGDIIFRLEDRLLRASKL